MTASLTHARTEQVTVDGATVTRHWYYRDEAPIVPATTPARTVSWWVWVAWLLAFFGAGGVSWWVGSASATGVGFGPAVQATPPPPAASAAPTGRPCRELLERWRAGRTWGSLTQAERAAAEAAIRAEGGR